MRVTENPETGVFVRTSNALGFFVQPDRGGGAVVTGAVSHARIHVIAVRRKTPAVSSLFSKLSSTKPER